jgi:hypothetical protein
MSKTWEGDIDAKVYQRVKEKGYSTVREFAESLPTKSYVELAKELGEDVAGIQIEAVLADEYQNANELVRFIKSNLVRCLNKFVKNGWDVDEDFDDTRSSAYASWASSFVGNGRNIAEKSWKSLKNSNNLHRGWLPKDADDPILTEAFKEF